MTEYIVKYMEKDNIKTALCCTEKTIDDMITWFDEYMGIRIFLVELNTEGFKQEKYLDNFKGKIFKI